MIEGSATRRDVLRKLAASGVTVTAIAGLESDVASAQKNECPPGTSLLAKYNVSDEGTFEFEKGEDVVTFSNVSRKEEEEITGFS